MRNPYEQHLSEKALGADPLELVVMLYTGAREAMAAARRHLHEGHIADRSAKISQAIEIVAELSRSLNYEQGRDMAANLDRLYSFVIDRLNEANVQQAEQPIVEAERVMKALEEGWRSCVANREAVPASTAA